MENIKYVIIIKIYIHNEIYNKKNYIYDEKYDKRLIYFPKE